MSDKLSQFIGHARQKGMDHATIFRLLESSGWKEKEIAEAIASHDLTMPIPDRPGVGSARDAFFHLLAFTALFAWAISLITLLFNYIGFAFPDPATRYSTYAVEAALSGMRTALATIIVAFPLFLAVWWTLLREIREAPELAKSGVRRWLASLTLFVGAVTVMGDVITAIYYLINGELTISFVLKVLALLIVAGSISIYLAMTLRLEAEARK
jgi:hypothetical protein